MDLPLLNLLGFLSNSLNSTIQQEVINFIQVILKQSPQKKKKKMPVITVYIVYSLWCFNYTSGSFIVKVYFLLWVYLCGLDGAPQVLCAFCSTHGHRV